MNIGGFALSQQSITQRKNTKESCRACLQPVNTESYGEYPCSWLIGAAATHLLTGSWLPTAAHGCARSAASWWPVTLAALLAAGRLAGY